MQLVTLAEIRAAAERLEGAGAVGAAALARHAVHADGRPVVALLSGGNVDLNLLGRIVEHGLSVAGRYLLLRLLIPDRPGQLERALTVVGEAGANVLSVEHRRTGAQISFGAVEVELLLETRNPAHARAVSAALEGAGYRPDPAFERLARVATFSSVAAEE